MKTDDCVYKCKCGYIFEERFGKYGCPFCLGVPPAHLVISSPAKMRKHA